VLSTGEKVSQKFVSKESDAIATCPLCQGKRDKLTNILEVGQLRKSANESTTVQQYFQENFIAQHTEYYFTLCFACRRLADNSGKPDMLEKTLPSCAKANADVIIASRSFKKKTIEEIVSEFMIPDSDD
jgi:hypothetical protein